MTDNLEAATATFSLSLLTSTRPNASKRLIADAQGLPIRDPEHKQGIARGRVQHVAVPGLAGLRDLIARTTARQALVHGIPRDSHPDDVYQLVLKDTYTGAPGTVARTLQCFTYPDDRFLLMLDHDTHNAAPVLFKTPKELLALLRTFEPQFGHVGWLAMTSTSSAIKAKDVPRDVEEWLTPPYGMHVYLLARGDVARWVDWLSVKLWLAGAGYCRLTRVNKATGVATVLERCVLDLAVFSPERLDYVSGAIIAKGEPFYQDRPPPLLQEGGILDIGTLSAITDAERREADARRQEARAQAEPEQRRAIMGHITAANPSMPADELDQEITRRLDQAARGELEPHHPLYFVGMGACTAGTVTKRHDGKRLADPLDPEAEGDAVFHWHTGGSTWRIVSWAHGGPTTYQLAPPSPPPADDDMAHLMAQAELLGRGTGNGLPTRFQMDDRALWYTPPLEDDGTQPPRVLVCAPLHVVAATRDEDNNNHGHLLEFLDRHDHPQQWAMPLELLEDQREYRKVLRRLGLRIRGATRGLLQEYLEQIDVQARVRCVARVGWMERAYVLPGAVLGESCTERLVLQTMDHTTEGYRQKGSLEGWRAEVAARCIGNTRLVFAVSAAFAAPLLVLLDEESGGVHFRGTSSEGKTTTILVAGSVWGEPDRLENWRATANGLEGVALAHNDNLLCLDELKQIDPKEAGSVAYMLANGVGKRRSKEHGGLRARLKWRLLFLSTGELSLEKHMADAGQRIQAGQEVRLVDLPADAGAGHGLFEDLHESPTGQAFAEALKAQATQHYGSAGRAFVTKVAEAMAAAAEDLRKTIDGWLTALVPPDAPGQVYRVARRFALIGAAGELATAYALTGWERGDAAAAAARCFRDWLEHRGGFGNADEDRAIAQVQLYFEQYGRARFEPWRGGDGVTCQRCHGTGLVDYAYMQGICFACDGMKVITPDHPAIRLIQVRAGWSKATDDGGTEFYVQKEVFRQDIAKGLDVLWLCRVLKDRGFLLPDSRGKNVRKESLPGRPSGEVYRITADLLGAQRPGEKEREEEKN